MKEQFSGRGACKVRRQERGHPRRLVDSFAFGRTSPRRASASEEFPRQVGKWNIAAKYRPDSAEGAHSDKDADHQSASIVNRDSDATYAGGCCGFDSCCSFLMHSVSSLSASTVFRERKRPPKFQPTPNKNNLRCPPRERDISRRVQPQA